MVVDYVRILPFGPGGCALVASVDVVVSAASVATRGRTSATEHTAYLILHHRNKFSISLSVALREVHLMSLGECFCSLETVLQLLSLNGALNLIIQSLLRRSLHSFFFLLAIFSSLLFLIPLLLRLVDTLRAIFSSRRVDVIVHGFWCLCPRGRLPLKFAVQHLLFDLSNLLILFNLFFFSYNSCALAVASGLATATPVSIKGIDHAAIIAAELHKFFRARRHSVGGSLELNAIGGHRLERRNAKSD